MTLLSASRAKTAISTSATAVVKEGGGPVEAVSNASTMAPLILSSAAPHPPPPAGPRMIAPPSQIMMSPTQMMPTPQMMYPPPAHAGAAQVRFPPHPAMRMNPNYNTMRMMPSPGMTMPHMMIPPMIPMGVPSSATLSPPLRHQQQHHQPPMAVSINDEEFPALGGTPTNVIVRDEQGNSVPNSGSLRMDALVIDGSLTRGGGGGGNGLLPQQFPSPPPMGAARYIFNNPNPCAPPINARLVSTKLMPPRDVCFIVHLMLRSLKTLDAYNDDYYHWSVINKATANLNRMGVMTNTGLTSALLPNPVWKEVKVIANAREEKFHNLVKDQAAKFAEKNKSLGQMVKMNVHRPKALLTTHAMKKNETDVDDESAVVLVDSKYESSQLVKRMNLWKARVSIDKGYGALLSLIELRRLIQANVHDAPNRIPNLMVDVKCNVDMLHSSLGVRVLLDPMEGRKTIDMEDAKLASTLSLPKGKVLCARAIEDGILPHSSACQLVSVALSCILSSTVSTDGEDRLVQALTTLIVLPNPALPPVVFCRCLDVPIALVRENGGSMAAIACTRTRMNLLHALLARGKDVCASSSLCEEWSGREEIFGSILAESSIL